MESDMMVNSRMTGDMVPEGSSGQMAESMMVAGKLANNMVRASSSLKTMLRNEVNGKTAKGSNGSLNKQMFITAFYEISIWSQ
jgi:hypothetical protein